LGKDIEQLIKKGQSALIFGPRQVGKTTLVNGCLPGIKNTMTYLLQDPETRAQLEKDPALIIRQIEAVASPPLVFVDEAQKVPDLFDAMQLVLDKKLASFLITGSSARKLKKRGANLLPGRVKSFRLDPLSLSELGWIKESILSELKVGNLNKDIKYSFEKSLVFGSLPGIVCLPDDNERKDFLKSYSHIYLEEEIRNEALVRKVGPFSRFLELAANESGTSPNLTKLSIESGVSVPAIKEFYNLLEDTLVIERVDPYLKNARKRILSSPRYFFFDLGVRNALARMPLTDELINSQKGRLFEHAVVLELIRRIRILKKDFRICFWRTSGGAEVDCIIDLGQKVIPIEIKASKKVSLSEIKGLTIFLEEYKKAASHGYVVTMGQRPEKLAENILAIPWNYL
jgi:predicted AAA+ superfamily ATPase